MADYYIIYYNSLERNEQNVGRRNEKTQILAVKSRWNLMKMDIFLPIPTYYY